MIIIIIIINSLIFIEQRLWSVVEVENYCLMTYAVCVCVYLCVSVDKGWQCETRKVCSDMM